MKYLLNALVVLIIILGACSCRKTSFTNSPDAIVNFSEDTLHFDTVFTSTGSVTQSVKIFNRNDQKLRLSNIKLVGGSSSAFKINVDGTPGINFPDIELEPNDSVYVFISVTINPNTSDLPFIVQDSISVSYNGNSSYIQLEAFGQNAHFFRNRRVTTDSAWNNDLPYVIMDGFAVDSNVTLTIKKGCKIYCHADAPFIVNGTLRVNGGLADENRVIFSGDRLDPDYKDLPAGWPGVYFTSSSVSNVLTYAIIRNAYQGIISISDRSAFPKIALSKCVIDNIYDAGIITAASSINAVNCLITNCGSNLALLGGGDYFFDYCTVASVENLYFAHKNPVLLLSNAYQEQVFPLTARFRNCIFYGAGGIADNEVVTEKKGTPSAADYNISFQNVLYRNKDASIDALFTNSIKNQPPEFDSIDVGKKIFNYHLRPTSPAVDTGLPIPGIATDLDGNARETSTDIGCYEL